MSEFSRDMSRAQWQRTEAMVVYSAFADELFQDSEAVLPDSDIVTILQGGYPGEVMDDMTDRARLTPLQTQAYRIGQRLFMGKITPRINQQLPPLQVRRNVRQYTYTETILGSLREATNTMACFPLNTAFTLSAIAFEQDVEDFKISSLYDLPGVLRRDDVRTIISDAAFTANSVWSSFSTEAIPNMRPRSWSNSPFIYDRQSQEMRLDDDVIKRIRGRLARNNHDGVSNDDAQIERRTSSGCPVRHTRPHFTSSEKDQTSIRMLANYYGKTKEELLAPRVKTGIEVGLDFLCEGLDRACQIKSRLGGTAMAVGF